MNQLSGDPQRNGPAGPPAPTLAQAPRNVDPVRTAVATWRAINALSPPGPIPSPPNRPAASHDADGRGKPVARPDAGPAAPAGSSEVDEYPQNSLLNLADATGLLTGEAASGVRDAIIRSAGAAQHRNYPSATALAATIYNETASLSQVALGPSVDLLRDAIANVVLNRIDQKVPGWVAPSTLSPSARTVIFKDKAPAAVAAYQSSLAAATAALHRTGAPESGAASAVLYNNRPTDWHTSSSKYAPPAPFDATMGPYHNVAPTPQAPANSTYFVFFGRPGSAR